MDANDYCSEWPELDIDMDDRRVGALMVKHGGKWIEARRLLLISVFEVLDRHQLIDRRSGGYAEE